MNTTTILYRFLDAYLKNEISTLFFTEEFTFIFTRYHYYWKHIEEREFNETLTENEREIYNNLSNWCFKYTDNPDELLNNYFISEIELKQIANNLMNKLKNL